MNPEAMDQNTNTSTPVNGVRRNKKLLLILVASGVLIVLIAIDTIVSFTHGTNNKTIQPTPIPISVHPSVTPQYDIEQNPTYAASVKKIEQERTSIRDKENAVGQLIHKLPYTGKYFTMSYSFAKNEFNVRISQSQKALGDKEFDTFLATNQINDRSWIRNLVITYY